MGTHVEIVMVLRDTDGVTIGPAGELVATGGGRRVVGGAAGIELFEYTGTEVGTTGYEVKLVTVLLAGQLVTRRMLVPGPLNHARAAYLLLHTK